MRNSTSRALRATATVAGVAALGASFVGTASADTGLGGLGGSDNSYGGSDSYGLSDFGGFGDMSDGKSLMDEPGYQNFEYACHEGNYAMFDSLSAGRAKDKAAAAKKR